MNALYFKKLTSLDVRVVIGLTCQEYLTKQRKPLINNLVTVMEQNEIFNNLVLLKILSYSKLLEFNIAMNTFQNVTNIISEWTKNQNAEGLEEKAENVFVSAKKDVANINLIIIYYKILYGFTVIFAFVAEMLKFDFDNNNFVLNKKSVV